MAIMYPTNPGNVVGSEAQVFDRLKHNLSNDWIVFHAVNKTEPRWSGSGVVMHELDFIAVHRTHGVFVLEVKGGHVWMENGEWKQSPSPHADGVIPKMIEKIRNRQGLVKNELRFFDKDISFGFIFPYTNWTQPQVNIGVEQAQIIDAKILTQDVEPLLLKMRYAIHGQFYNGLSDSDMRIIQDVFRPNVTTTEALWQHIQAVEQNIITLTEQQIRTMSWLRFPGIPQVAVFGCAGSGKTLIAIERAAELAQQGKRVLVTCFNTALAQMLIKHPKLCNSQTPIVVNNVHAIVSDLYRDQYMTNTNNAMDKIEDLCLNSRVKYDAIIIDEAQDFQLLWLEAFRFLLADPDNGHMYLFLDTNQNIYRQDIDALVKRLEVNPFSLQQNMRNTQQIGQIIRQTLPNAHEITFMGPNGQEVIERTYRDKNEMVRQLAQDVAQVVRSKVPVNQLVILTPKQIQRSHLFGVDNIADINLVDEVIDEKHQILFTSVYKYKGLESPIVFLVDIDTRKNHADNEKFDSNDRYQKYVSYVGASRARVMLYIYREVTT